MGAADPADDTPSGAAAQGHSDCAAVSPQGGAGPPRESGARAMSDQPRGLIVPIIATSIAFALLVSLGVWQLSRKQWKEALIDNMTARFLAPPVALPSPDKWPSMSAEN